MKTFLVALCVLLTSASMVLAQDPTPAAATTHFMPDGFLGDLLATFAFGLVAIVVIIVGYKIFDRLTPSCPFETEIQKGNVAVAILAGSFILGICYVMARIGAAVIGQ